MSKIFKIEIIIGTVVILISFITALKVNKTKEKPDNLSHFYLYPLLAFSLSILTFTENVIKKLDHRVSPYFESVYIVFELFLLGIFFLKTLKSDPSVKSLKTIFILCLIIITGLILRNNFKTYNYEAAAISNLFFCLCSCIYFKRLFLNEPIIIITQDSTFWIVSGIFFYSTFSLPLYPISAYFRNNEVYAVSQTLILLINLLVIIMHLFFIKSFLCLLKQTKV